MQLTIVTTLLQVTALAAGPASPEALDHFEKKIRPVLVQQCYRCHSAGAEKVKAGLRLDSRDAMLKGGDSGPALVPGDPDASLIVLAIRQSNKDLKMPPKEKLPANVIADFETWVKAGAVTPASDAPPVDLALHAAARKHWALQPLRTVEPKGTPEANGKNPIDRFIDGPLHDRQLKATDRAGRRTLIRRATFDLLGLPPSPEDVDAFVKDDGPDAYVKLIDRLLASRHYGERWGRHWLDVVRYADTAGETADFPAPHAWRYRNYVIDAFNADKPYDQFIREQVAGDLLAKELPPDAPSERYAELITATGYIAIARRFGFDIESDHFLTVDDTIDTLGKSVLGLTIACARCHDHKYDPIEVEDYYALYGIFESTRYPFPGCEKTKVPRDLVTTVSAETWQREIAPHQAKIAQAEAALKQASTEETQVAGQMKGALAKHSRTLAEGTIDQAGKQSFNEPAGAALESVTIAKGELLLLSIDRRANHGADSTLVELAIEEVGNKERRWNATQEMLADAFANNPHADGYANERTWSFVDLRGPRLLAEPLRDFQGKQGLNIWRRGDTPSAWVTATDQPVTVWTTLSARSLFVHPAPDGAVGIMWLSPIDGVVRIKGLVADAHPQGGDGIAWKIEHFSADFKEHIASLAKISGGILETSQELAKLKATAPTPQAAYAVVEGSPHDAQIQIRGDPASRGATVPRRFLSILGGQTLENAGSSGRLELARWLTDPKNPLTARVMVNRIWQHHFGTGLVATPNDFGTRGQPPSHPALLDFLARHFIEHDWSIKAMHRLIMTSDAYQRDSVTSVSDTALAAEDPDNVQLWRFNRRRLSAEEIRDAILLVSGQLDTQPGGPHPFPAEPSWGFTQHNPFNAVYDHNKRSVYLMTQRLKRHPFLALFDGPDTASSTAQRYTTTVPTQSLFFMNDSFIHENADRFASALSNLKDDDARLDRAFRLCFARTPTADESAAAKAFFADYERDLTEGSTEAKHKASWAAWLRVMMSSNEFLYVD